MCIDSNTNTIYVGDSTNFVIRRISNGLVTTIAGNGINSNVDNSIGSNASFRDITTLTINSTGTILYAAGYADPKIRIIDLRPGSNFAVTSSTSNYTNTYGICIDPTNTYIYYANYNGGGISRILISTWAIDYTITKAGYFTRNVFINNAGTTLYYSTVADNSLQNRIAKVNLISFTHTTIVGDGTIDFPADGPGLSIKLWHANYLVVDPSESYLYFGIVYSGQGVSPAVRKVELTSGSNMVTTISGNSIFSIGSTFSIIPSGMVYNPSDNRIYYVDGFANRITTIIPSPPLIQNATGRQVTIAVPNATVTNSNLNSVGISDVKTLHSISDRTYTLL